MIETSSVPPRKSSATFGNLRQSSAIFGKCSENVRKIFGDVRQAFGTILENLRKSSESGRKSSENRQKRSFYNKHNNTWTL